MDDDGPDSVPLAAAERDPERTASYDFAFAPEQVAQRPAARRDAARLLHVRRHAAEETSGELAEDVVIRDGHIPDLVSALEPGDLVVLNETRVRPARLVGRRSSGGRVSILVLSGTGRRAWALLGARGTLLEGERLEVAGDTWRVASSAGDGRFEIAVEEGRDVDALLASAGRMPLPPYIRRDPEADAWDALDRDRYQTVFAKRGDGDGAVAAPTAGLHFTEELLSDLERSGVAVANVRLDVGEGTFRPLRAERIDGHRMHTEHFAIPAAAAEAYAACRARGGRVVAVGTTVVRALESAVAEDGRALRVGAAETSLFIRPGFRFRAVDVLLTNFHQPKSTLLVLVSAFAGLRTIRAAYDYAVTRGYRLFSYGDAMLLTPS